MPIYEYECPKCGRFEVVQKVGEKDLNKDPDCARTDCPRVAKRVISPAAFHFKGGGFYKTDYASSSTPSKPAAKSEAPAATDTSKPADTSKKAAPCGPGCGCR